MFRRNKDKEIDLLNTKLNLMREQEKVANRDKFIAKQQEEFDTLKNNVESFKMDFENITKGKRKPEDMLEKIKESYYLYLDNNSN